MPKKELVSLEGKIRGLEADPRGEHCPSHRTLDISARADPAVSAATKNGEGMEGLYRLFPKIAWLAAILRP